MHIFVLLVRVVLSFYIIYLTGMNKIAYGALRIRISSILTPPLGGKFGLYLFSGFHWLVSALILSQILWVVISVLVLCLLFGGELIYHSFCPKIIHPAIHFLHVGISLVSPHFVSITNVNVYIYFLEQICQIMMSMFQ